MHGIVSLLDDRHDRQLRDIWTDLDRALGIRAIIDRVPFPHFSYHVAEEYDLDRLEDSMKEVARSAAPLTVASTGLGIFLAPQPVIYVALVRDQHLSEFHRRVWDGANMFARGSADYYAPPRWVPHITLVQLDVTRDNLPDAIRLLSRYDLEGELQVDNLALIYDSGNPHEVRWKMRLSG